MHMGFSAKAMTEMIAVIGTRPFYFYPHNCSLSLFPSPFHSFFLSEWDFTV